VSARIAANSLGYLLVMYTGQADMVVRGTWGGAPETLLDCRGEVAHSGQRVAAGATGFVFAGPRCFGGGTTVATVGMTGPPLPVPGLSAPESYGLAYAEPFVAMLGTGIDVVDTRSGALRHTDTGDYADFNSPLSLLGDGTLVTGPATELDHESIVPQGVHAWAPDGSAPKLVAQRNYVEDLIAAGRSVFMESDRGLELASLDGGRARLLGAPGLGRPETPLYFDGRIAAFRDTTCFGREQTTWLDVTERARPGSENGCPVSMYSGDLHFGPSGRTTLAVRCRNGCNAILSWMAQGPAGFCRIPPTDIPNPFPHPCATVAQAKLRLAPSRRTQHIVVRLNEEGLRARREGFHRIPVRDTELSSLGLSYQHLVSRLIFV
jgi:hypothetical protein